MDSFKECTARTMLKFKKNFLKYWLDQELNNLNSKAIASDKLWRSLGRPRSGSVHKEHLTSTRTNHAFIRVGQMKNVSTQTTCTRR